MQSITVTTPYSLKDPLSYGLILQYLKSFQEKYPNQYKFHYFTEEQKNYLLSQEDALKMHEELAKINIIWHPAKYRNGKFIIIKKAFNMLLLLLTALKIRLTEKNKINLGFTAPGSIMGYMISTFLFQKNISMCFEPHSQYMVEFGEWSRSSLKYKLVNYFEKKVAVNSNVVAAPTTHMIDLLKSWNSKAKIYYLPIAIDTNEFRFNENKRNEIRKKHNIENRIVVQYLGKFNGIYYSPKEVAEFCKKLLTYNSDFFFYIITPDNVEMVKKEFESVNLGENNYYIREKISYPEVEGFLSASDIGLLAIPPHPTQKFRTPVKTANYLSCGLPYIVNRGISNDDKMAEDENVGVVFENFEDSEFQKNYSKIMEYMNEDKITLRDRCRKTCIKYRGIENTVEVMKNMLDFVSK